jgi:hypothetical protein
MPPPPGTNTPLSNELCAAALTREEVGLAEALLGRVAKLAAAAAEKGVRLMIDAEHTYFQPVRSGYQTTTLRGATNGATAWQHKGFRSHSLCVSMQYKRYSSELHGLHIAHKVVQPTKGECERSWEMMVCAWVCGGVSGTACDTVLLLWPLLPCRPSTTPPRC